MNGRQWLEDIGEEMVLIITNNEELYRQMCFAASYLVIELSSDKYDEEKALKYANSLRLKAMKTNTWKGSQLNKNRKLLPEDKRVINQVILKDMLTNLNDYADVGDSYRQTRVAKKR